MPFVYGTPLHRAALAADDAWQTELVKQFGKRAGDMRYTPAGAGEPGTPLRAAHDARQAATAAWATECARPKECQS